MQGMYALCCVHWCVAIISNMEFVKGVCYYRALNVVYLQSGVNVAAG